MKAKTETITPEIAGELLKKNTHNRRVRAGYVDYLASEMANGRWCSETAEAIKIADDGTIVDGQHRLLAIKQSNTAIEVMVARGVPLRAQELMDGGTPRTVADNLQLSDRLTSANLKVATVRQIVSICCYYQNPRVSIGMARFVLAEYQRDIDTVIAQVSNFRPGMRGWIIGTLAFALHADRQALSFIQAFGSGENLSRGSPAKAARDWLISGAAGSAKLRNAHTYKKPAVEGLMNAVYNDIFKNPLSTIRRGAQGVDYFTGKSRRSVATIREQMKYIMQTPV